MRERGLKSPAPPARLPFPLSLPVRERGLKSAASFVPSAGESSLPVRERGLKSARATGPSSGGVVAPRAGAWVEIRRKKHHEPLHASSLPVRERGLKFVQLFTNDIITVCRSPCGSVG